MKVEGYMSKVEGEVGVEVEERVWEDKSNNINRCELISGLGRTETLARVALLILILLYFYITPMSSIFTPHMYKTCEH